MEYWLTQAFARFASIEAAGKLVVSLSVLLMGAVVVRATQRQPHAHTPWVLLASFPLVFNQTYFLGFENVLLSLPLLLLALLDLEDFAAQPIRMPRALRHAAYLAALLLYHPFSALLYLAFASASASFVWKDRARLRRMRWPVALLALVVARWAIEPNAAPTNENHRAWVLLWWPFDLLCKFYAIQFTGMRITGGVDVLSLALWAALILSLCASASRAPSGVTLRHPYLAWFGLALAGYCALPFWLGYYHVIAGGGANPNLFSNPMLPVRLVPDAPLPTVEYCPHASFAWERFQPYHRHVLVRGAYPLLDDYLAYHAILRARSGEWTLYENPKPPSP